MHSLLDNARKFFAMSSRDMWIRLGAEFWMRLDHSYPGKQEQRIDQDALLRLTGVDSITTLHKRVYQQPMPWNSRPLTRELLDEVVPDSSHRVIERAEAVMDGWVCLMGSGSVQLGDPADIDWFRDAMSGLDWPFEHFSDLNPTDIDRPSDVKYPWELSRMQWLLPVAQAWHLTGDDRYASHLRAVIEAWLGQNPTCWGINWSCTMEPAMRIITLCWFYQMVGNSPSWADQLFRHRFLTAIYLHLKFVRRYLEITDVNGNHLIADAAALVVGGVFLGGNKVTAWRYEGWRILEREVSLQVYPDGVDFEGSVPYHRLVAELFHVAAAAEQLAGGKVSTCYQDRLLAMADYTEAYTRPDGLAPTWGDNDDARILPLGGLVIQNHRYLPSLIRAFWRRELLTDAWRNSAEMCLWWWGQSPEMLPSAPDLTSRAFEQGGSYIMRKGGDFVFFDCGPLGLANRGGHGHNDMLAFEATLDGVYLVADPGCPVYSSNWQMRNLYRTTQLHSTPQVGGEEINRFISPKNLWFMHGDAHCAKTVWNEKGPQILVQGQHSGYERLTPSVYVMRTLMLDTDHHAVVWRDNIKGAGCRSINITLQLASGVEVIDIQSSGLMLHYYGRYFYVKFISSLQWDLKVESSKVSPSYGVLLHAQRLTWTAVESSVLHDLFVAIIPAEKYNPVVVDELQTSMNSIINCTISD